MGACIGKKNSKYLTHDQRKSDSIRAPQPKTQDDIVQNKCSPSPSKKLQMADECTANNDDDEFRISKIDEISIDSELQIIIDEQKIINQVLNQPFTTRVVSSTDTELEYELANLIYESSVNGHIENPPVTTTLKSVDA